LKHFGLPTHVSVTGSDEAMLFSCDRLLLFGVKLDSTMFAVSLVSELHKFRAPKDIMTSSHHISVTVLNSSLISCHKSGALSIHSLSAAKFDVAH